MAREFAGLASALQNRGHDPQRVAHFLNKLLFSMFAEDASLLPRGLLKRLVEGAAGNPETFSLGLSDLFTKMSDHGGLFGPERIQWFNGGLFDSGEVLPLTAKEIATVGRVSELDWTQVEPAIFGTLFERGLDPGKRSQLGAHYTDRQSIETLVEAVLLAPLRRDFTAVKERVTELLAEGRPVTKRTPAERNPQRVFDDFLDRLRAITVLDPACGSGNFLYIALQSLKDLEREAIVWGALTLHTSLQFPLVGVQALRGIEANPYAAELARVVIWIGEIQWMLSNGFSYLRDPVLRPLDSIECRDAVLDLSDPSSPREPTWPQADVIVGNPPFVGGKLMRGYLGNNYVDTLFRVYGGRVAPEADYVCYWFEKDRAMVAEDRAHRVGLLGTQGIRGGASRRVLDRVKETGDIFMARSDEPWVLEGAAVHVSFIAFDNGSEPIQTLDGTRVVAINANLTAGLDLTKARRLPENLGLSFMGGTKGGPFDLTHAQAQQMLAAPLNTNRRPNSDVVRPWVTGVDINQRGRGMWIIDFGIERTAQEAASYELPFEYLRRHVYPIRQKNNRASYRERWWLFMEPRPAMRAALSPLARYIGTSMVSKHRIFAWLDQQTWPENLVIVVARDDDYFFGVLHSKLHRLWARAMGTQLREAESGSRYTPSTTFETFPFPWPPGQEPASDPRLASIIEVARALVERRDIWLNPPGEIAASELKRRTTTNLYNEYPTWLAHLHEQLDQAVLGAYGWEDTLSDAQIAERLLMLNLQRCGASPPIGAMLTPSLRSSADDHSD